MHLSPLYIEDALKAALKEDLGHGFDITSDILIPASTGARGILRAREAGRLAGLIVALSSFSMLDGDFEMSVHINDGEDFKAGDIIAEIEGPARAMLSAERVALNFLNHMSGVASMTAEYVREIKGTGAEICDTRKTLPGLRLFQKYAVYMGGGANHRFGLDDAVLIKDNHIAVVGGISAALDQARMLAGHTKKIEIEVDNIKQLEQVLKHGGADIVLLDNFTLANLKKAVSLAKGQVILEASGGVNLETVKAIAKTGVDMISVGALTHSAPQVDIGLDIEI
jgi:nicotinate-nucleotide pyrophosphorylase (carboxylating)